MVKAVHRQLYYFTLFYDFCQRFFAAVSKLFKRAKRTAGKAGVESGEKQEQKRRRTRYRHYFFALFLKNGPGSAGLTAAGRREGRRARRLNCGAGGGYRAYHSLWRRKSCVFLRTRGGVMPFRATKKRGKRSVKASPKLPKRCRSAPEKVVSTKPEKAVSTNFSNFVQNSVKSADICKNII